MRGRRRRGAALGALALTLAGVVLGVAAFGGGDDRDGDGGGRDGARPAESRDRLRERFEREAPALEREGIYVTTYWLSDESTCRYGVGLGVANPTPPNLAALRRRFGTRFCVERSTFAERACPGAFVDDRGPRRRVPDLRGMGIATALRHARAAGLSATIQCPGIVRETPPRLEPPALARMALVTRQSPRPGARWPVRRPIALEAVARLPGGFTYTFTGFGDPG